MTKFIILLLVELVLLAPPAWSIGRIGNSSIGSEEEGFVTSLPSVYPITKQMSSRRLILESPWHRGSEGHSTDISAQPVSDLFPHWTEASREEVETDIEAIEPYYDRIPHSDLCVFAARWVDKKNNRVFGLATWGRARGVLFWASGSRITWDSIEQMLIDLELLPGACSWG